MKVVLNIVDKIIFVLSLYIVDLMFSSKKNASCCHIDFFNSLWPSDSYGIKELKSILV